MLSQPSIDMYSAKRSQQPLDANIFSARQRAALLQLKNHLALGDFIGSIEIRGWLGSRVVSVLDSGAEGPGFKLQPRRCRVTVLGKQFTPIVPLLTVQRAAKLVAAL